MRVPWDRAGGARGFTLMEIVIAITILGIVATILTGVFVSNADICGFLARSGEDVEELRLAAGRITLELRSIRDKNSIGKATATNLVFATSRDETIDLDYDRRRSELTLNGNVLAGGLSSCEFRYYDSAGSLLPNPRTKPDTNIWSIEVELLRAGKGGLAVVARSHPRNFL